MKKFLVFPIALVFSLIVACGTDGKNENKSDTGDTSADTGADIATDTTDSGDTVQPDDHDIADTGNDSEPAENSNDNETADTDESGNDNETADNDEAENYSDSDNSEDTNPPSECTGLSFDLQNLINSQEYQHIWYIGYDPRFFMQFYFENGYGRMPSTGTYDLGSGLNTNYKTCTECVSIYQDVVNENYTNFYFQEGGTLTVESYDEFTRGLSGTISAKLVEVELDDKNNSTPLPNGSCIEIEAAAFNSSGCIKQCDGKDCGDDGCGGSCGTCRHDQGCSTESKCVNLDFSGCVGLSVDWSNMVQYATDKFYAVKNGGNDPRATIQFSQDINTGKITEGTYDLGSEINSHYKTCTECVLVYSDYFINASGYGEYAKKYFQHDGTMIISSVDENNRIKGTLSARILEATMDDKLMTNFVIGGKCFEIESAVLDTAE